MMTARSRPSCRSQLTRVMAATRPPGPQSQSCAPYTIAATGRSRRIADVRFKGQERPGHRAPAYSVGKAQGSNHPHRSVELDAGRNPRAQDAVDAMRATAAIRCERQIADRERSHSQLRWFGLAGLENRVEPHARTRPARDEGSGGMPTLSAAGRKIRGLEAHPAQRGSGRPVSSAGKKKQRHTGRARPMRLRGRQLGGSLPVFSDGPAWPKFLTGDTGSGRSRTARGGAATCSASRTPRSRCRRPARPS